MSYHGFGETQTNRTLHNFTVYRTQIDIGAHANSVGDTLPLFTTASHLGYFYPDNVLVYSRNLVGATQPVINVGFSATGSAATRCVDFASAQTLTCTTQNRFQVLALTAATSGSARAAPPSVPVRVAISTLPGTTTNTVAFSTPASIGGSVTVTVGSSSAYSPIGTYGGQQIFVWNGANADVYTVTAVPTATSMTIQLVSLGSSSLGQNVPIGTQMSCPGLLTVVVSGFYLRGE